MAIGRELTEARDRDVGPSAPLTVREVIGQDAWLFVVGKPWVPLKVSEPIISWTPSRAS